MVRDLLLPATDRMVLIQLVVVLAVWGAGLVLLRRQREWQLLLSGVAMVLLGWFGLRAVH